MINFILGILTGTLLGVMMMAFVQINRGIEKIEDSHSSDIFVTERKTISMDTDEHISRLD